MSLLIYEMACRLSSTEANIHHVIFFVWPNWEMDQETHSKSSKLTIKNDNM